MYLLILSLEVSKINSQKHLKKLKENSQNCLKDLKNYLKLKLMLILIDSLNEKRE